MELNNRKPALPGADRLPKAELKPDLTRKLREATPEARARVEEASEARQSELNEQVERTRTAAARQEADTIELSPAARALAEGGDNAELQPVERGSLEPAPERAARIAKLREQMEAGTLNTPERADRAADAILGKPLGDVANPA